MNLPKTSGLFGLFCALLPWAAFGQTDSVLAVLYVEQIEDKITVQAYCHNGSGQDRTLTYQLRFVRTDANGNRSSSQQGGGFKIAAGNDAKLSSTTMNLGEEPQLAIFLDIFENGRLLTRDSFPKPEEPTVVPPTPSEDVDEGNGFIDPQDNPDPTRLRGGIDLGGLVLDQTKTVWGQQFFQLFTQQWQAQNVTGDFIIVIEEAPFRGRTTLAKVKLDDDYVLTRTLQAKYDYLEELAGLAVRVVLGRIQQMRQVQQDIRGEDLSGSGIY